MKWTITVILCMMLLLGGCTTIKRVQQTTEDIEHVIALTQLALTNAEQAFVIWQKFMEGKMNPLIEAEKIQRTKEIEQLRGILADLYKKKATQ